MDEEEPEKEEESEEEPRGKPQGEATDPIEIALTLYPLTITRGTDTEFRRNVIWRVCHKARMGNRPSEF